jgi:hypothetical protein
MSGAAPVLIPNARTQLLATAFNNLGVGAMIAGVLAPSINGTIADLPHVVVWAVFGVDLIWLAQVWLGRLR